MSGSGPDEDRLLTPQEVAAMFHVSPKTVARWATAGRISAVRTLGGHRRYRESEALALLRQPGLAQNPGAERPQGSQ